MELDLDQDKVKKLGDLIFCARVHNDECLEIWRSNMMSDDELIHRLSYLNVGCTREAETRLIEEMTDQHEQFLGAGT
jgi:hypothetical protein